MRTSGILMPVFSLASNYGIGTFGKKAYEFVDFLEKAGQSYWQILPLNPTNYGDSPYQSFSSFAGNPYFIDPEMLIEEGLIERGYLDSLDFGDNPYKIDYEKLYINRIKMLKTAFLNFKGGSDYNEFCKKNAYWLDGYAKFMALKAANSEKSWYDFEKKEDAENTQLHRFIQYKFCEQWNKLKTYANSKGIKIIGDIPIYVALDSADVWADKKQFLLDSEGKPQLVAGCPPDAFSKDGQLWGNPLYDWEYMKKDDYSWWKRRLSYALELYDVVRIDHFRGFESFYAIPAKDTTAKNGKWIKGPGAQLFKSLEKSLGQLPIIAEDLGFLTKEVRQMLKDTGYPGMKVLQFAFDSREESDYLPHNYTKNCVVYTGTHDNDTIMGWTVSTQKSDVEYAKKYMGVNHLDGFNWVMMRTALSSVADTAILMMPDLLCLGSEGRINTPSTLGENWKWRIEDGCINDWLSGILRDVTATYHRLAKNKDTNPTD